MRQDFEKLFSYLKTEEPSVHLFVNILNLVEENRRASARNRLILNAAALAVSFAAFIPAIYWLTVEISQSGFFQYLNLIFSDAGIISAYWQNFGLLLLESLPALSLTLTLAAFFGLLYFLKRVMSNLKLYPIKI